MTTLPRRGRRNKAKESRKYRYQAGTGSHSGTYYLPPPGKDMCVTEAYTLLRVGADTFREDLKTLGFYSPEPEHRWLSWSQVRTLLGLHLFKRAITCRSNGQQSNLRIAFAALIRANQGLDPDTALTELEINLSVEFKELKNDYQQRIEPIKHILRKRCFRGGKSPGRKQEKQQSQQTGFPFC